MPCQAVQPPPPHTPLTIPPSKSLTSPNIEMCHHDLQNRWKCMFCESSKLKKQKKQPSDRLILLLLDTCLVTAWVYTKAPLVDSSASNPGIVVYQHSDGRYGGNKRWREETKTSLEQKWKKVLWRKPFFFFKELSRSCKMWDLEGPNGMMAFEKAKTEFANVKLLQLLIRHA